TTINGTLTIGSGTTLDVTSNNNSLTIKGDFVNDGTYTARAGTVTFSGTAAQNIGGATPPTAFSGLTISNTTAAVLVSNNLNVTGTLSVSSGAVFSPAAAVVLNSAAAAGTISG